MEQRFITVNSIKLAYLEQNTSSDKTIFFIHGNSVSSRSWKYQFNSPLLGDYRLIAIDLPAHGNSDSSNDPETDYTLPGLGFIMANAIKSLVQDKPYILVGLSLGTNILAESLAFDLHPAGIVLISACIIGNNYSIEGLAKSNTNVHVVFTERSPEDEVSTYASQAMQSTDKNDISEFIADYYIVKPQLRHFLTASIYNQKYSNEIALLQKVNLPLLFIFGRDEQIVNPDYLDSVSQYVQVWNDTIYKIPAASHLVHSDQPEEVNKLIAEYIKNSIQQSLVIS
jgi:pimeloyl-ACP methyl ester carboxylesterase